MKFCVPLSLLLFSPTACVCVCADCSSFCQLEQDNGQGRNSSSSYSNAGIDKLKRACYSYAEGGRLLCLWRARATNEIKGELHFLHPHPPPRTAHSQPIITAKHTNNGSNALLHCSESRTTKPKKKFALRFCSILFRAARCGCLHRLGPREG